MTEGRRLAGTRFIVLVAPREKRDAGAPVGARLGVTVSRKVGGSVVRNRVKRRLREWFRRARPELPAGMDWVVIARSSARAASMDKIADELSRLCRMAGATLG